MEVKDTLDNIVARQKPGFLERLLGANRRIQDKITASLMRDNFNLLGEHQVQLRSGERDGLLKRIADRKIDADSFKNLLRKIDPGVNQGDTFKILSNYPQAMGVIAFYVEGNLLKRDLTIKDIAAFLDRYPDPISFEENKQEVLDRVAINNPVSKRKEYERTLRQMMPIVYGKRWEYWEQIRLLVLEAGQKQNHPEKSLKHRGVKQARKFQRIHRINETIEDGFLTAGRHVSIRKDGSVPSNTRTREVIEVDRQQDPALQDEIKRLKRDD